MVKRSEPDEIALDEIMEKSMKEMGKGEASHQEVVEEQTTEPSQNEEVKPQFGFKLGEVQTPESFIISTHEKEPEKDVKKQVILDKPSQSLDDDIIVEW
ncbi:MAG: hypothetical protein ACPG7Q_02720 [Candidatus Poseidoniaceae archaeon]|jgi:hypothetical protein